MGNYPKELNLGEEIENKLRSYINDELTRHDFERPQAIDELKKWQGDYWAEPVASKKTFPFTGAANIIIPLTAIALETIHARMMTTLFAPKPLVMTKSHGGDFFNKVEKPTENWVNHELIHNVKFAAAAEDALLEIEKFGTGVIKTGYEKVIKKGVRKTDDGSQEFPVIIKDGATVSLVPQANFLFPHSFRDPQLDPWCGEVHGESPYFVKLLEQSGFFRPGTYEKVLPWSIDNMGASPGGSAATARSYELKQEQLEKRTSHFPRKLYWQEISLAFDVDGDDQEEEIVVHYHYDSGTFMSIRYNWYDDLHRGYRHGVYMKIEGRWRGLGICKQNEQFQRSVTTMHRQRLDNATLANMQMIIIHKMSGYGPKEPIFPGKMWFVDDMTHIAPLKLNEVYNSAYANEQGTLSYSQQRTGANEAVLGMPAVGTPGTATSDLARIQEGNKKFDYVMMNIKNFLNNVIEDTFCNIIQFGSKNVEYFDYVDGGELLKQLVQMPVATIRKNLIFDIQLAGQQNNKLLDRQNWVQIASMIQQYYQAMLMLAEGQPQIQQLILQKGLTAATEAMLQILDTFDVKNKERIAVVEIEKLMKQGQQGQQGQLNAGSISQPGGTNLPSGNGQGPRLDVLTQIAQMFGNSGAGATPTIQR